MAKPEITLPAEVVEEISGQVGEFTAPIFKVVLMATSGQRQYWIGRKRKFEAELGKLIGFGGLREVWERFYRDEYNLRKDFSQLAIPNPRPGFERLIMEAGELTSNAVFARLQQLFVCWWYTDNLDAITDIAPWATGDRAYWVRDRVEADEELKNLSGNDLATQGIVTMPLKGRLLYEHKYFRETGQHLDIKNVTLCGGSRGSGGHVPGVDWGGGKLRVHLYRPGNAGDYLRGRAAVYA